jgi:hypothetical protein
MLRLLIAAMLFLVSVTSAAAGSFDERKEGVTVQLRIGARVGSSQALAPAVQANMPSAAMYRTINGVALTGPEAAGKSGMLALLDLAGDEQGLAVPVSDSVSLGLDYEYLRREDIHLEVAETGSLHEEYSTHNVVLRALWKF